tara:strand:- start:86266 stop:86439 length:174 start_codon:yes stop_codon:yes gene_type:complete
MFDGGVLVEMLFLSIHTTGNTKGVGKLRRRSIFWFYDKSTPISSMRLHKKFVGLLFL